MAIYERIKAWERTTGSIVEQVEGLGFFTNPYLGKGRQQFNPK
jgi:hypothetical protein